jgi:hypothetical protein
MQTDSWSHTVHTKTIAILRTTDGQGVVDNVQYCSVTNSRQGKLHKACQDSVDNVWDCSGINARQNSVDKARNCWQGWTM